MFSWKLFAWNEKKQPPPPPPLDVYLETDWKEEDRSDPLVYSLMSIVVGWAWFGVDSAPQSWSLTWRQEPQQLSYDKLSPGVHINGKLMSGARARSSNQVLQYCCMCLKQLSRTPPLTWLLLALKISQLLTLIQR